MGVGGGGRPFSGRPVFGGKIGAYRPKQIPTLFSLRRRNLASPGTDSRSTTEDGGLQKTVMCARPYSLRRPAYGFLSRLFLS